MIKTLEKRGLLSRIPGAARTLRVLVPAEELPGSDFGSHTGGARTPVASAGARSPSAADAAVTATLAVLEVVMPPLASATPRASGSKLVLEVARAVYESLGRLGMEESQIIEVSQRVAAEAARWERGRARHRRSSARVGAPLNDSAIARGNDRWRTDGHDVQFLERLERLFTPETELALSLYQDPLLIRALLDEIHLPESAVRVVLSLGDGARGSW
jgi:hypothetical protein